MADNLIVEDEDALRRIITLNLARRGFSVAEADSVATADEAIAATPRPFDLILLDINLPDQTGWDVLRHLQAANPAAAPQQRVIIITAVRPAQSRIEQFQPDAVLLKPFPLRALFALIDRVLAQPENQQNLSDTPVEEQGRLPSAQPS
ncbi:MAG: response regulator transcription factor [Ktedonobacterales bacterium]